MVIYETLWLVALGVVAALLAHEGGHLALALALRLGPRVLTLGKGSVMARLRVSALWVVIRAYPVTGYVLVEPTDRRWAYAAMVAGGPLANLLALAALLRAHELLPDADWPVVLAIYQGLFALATLFPARGKVAGVALSSDGLQLLNLLRRRPLLSVAARYASVLAHVEPVGAPAHPATRHTAKLLFALTRPDQFVDPWARRDAVAAVRALLDEPDLTRSERAYILCALCDYEFLDATGAVGTAETEAWSRDALALSDSPVVLGSRAGVLLLAGRRGEAEALYRAALGGYEARGEAESALAALCRAALARSVEPGAEAAALLRRAEAAPAIAGNALLRGMLTQIKARTIPRRPAEAP